MKKFNFSLALMGMLAVPLPLLAADPATPGAQSLDQYPSFVEFTSLAPDNTQTVIRCGYYSPDGHNVAVDAGYQEISQLNQARNMYSRLQHIDETVIQTTTGPQGMVGLLLQVVKPDGTMAAKNCQTDTNNDTIGNCQPAQPIMPPEQILNSDRNLGQQCVTLLSESAAKLNPALADPQKTRDFKNGLRQKVTVLTTP